MRSAIRLFLLLMVLMLTGCAGAPFGMCRGGLDSMVSAELLFGSGKVSEAAWQRFLDSEITPRFPQGLTVFEAAGQWRDPDSGIISRERSKAVLIVFRDDPAAHERLNAVAEA